jgi:NADPH:quinone reductase-like Zn-dependent oxidoreductase
MSKIVRIHEHGGPGVLRLEDIKVGTPDAGHVRIRVRAIGLNRADTNVRSGSYSLRSLPASLGFEAAGIVDAVGAGVETTMVGKAVAIIPLAAADYTTYGELINVPAWLVRPIPARLNFTQAAALWAGHLTAYTPLLEYAGLTAGDHVAVTAASSCVGLAAIQIANALGAIPIAVTQRREKEQRLLDAGAAHVVVSEEEDVGARLAAITAGVGPRVIFDLVAGRRLAKLLAAAAPGGTALLCGALDRETTLLSVEMVLTHRLTLKGCVLGETIQRPELLTPALSFIEENIAAGRFHPIVARIFPLEEIVAAHAYLESNEQIGKIVVTVGNDD